MIYIRSKTYILLTVALTLLSSYFIYDYMDYMNGREKESIRLGQESLDQVQGEIVSILDEIIAEGEKVKNIVESQNLSQEETKELVERTSRDVYYLQGVTVAYEPEVVEDTVKLFSPYYDKRQGRVIQLEEKYDYTSDTIATNEWYLGPLDENGPHWTDPYFGTGAKLLVADYGLPFYLGGASQPSGVISLTLDLKKLGAKMDSLAVGQTGTIMVFSEAGNLVAHPISEYILDLSLPTMAEELGFEEFVDVISLTESGNMSYSRYSGKQSYIFYAEIPNVTWKTIVIFNSSDLLGGARLVHVKLVQICLSVSGVVFLLLLLFIKKMLLRGGNYGLFLSFSP